MTPKGPILDLAKPFLLFFIALNAYLPADLNQI